MPSEYIELLKKTLIDYSMINKNEYHPLDIVRPSWKTFFLFPLHRILKKRNFAIGKIKRVNEHDRLNGYDWPANALTMIGLNRLNNIEDCIRTILRDKIEGDFIETGVWRGGATILMRAVLKELEIKDRVVWLADSFEGLPKPNTNDFPADKGNELYKLRILSCSLEEVQHNFKVYGLLDDQVKFIPGWFKDTLPTAPVQQISLLRLDGDLYESTFTALKYLYPNVSSGGFVIVDDYNAFPYCKAAVDAFRKEYKIEESMIEIDKEAIYWRKK
ncbi:MAG: O-methyltransferase [Crocinitomicaceae bacterium]|jgi:O-methyltransferase